MSHHRETRNHIVKLKELTTPRKNHANKKCNTTIFLAVILFLYKEHNLRYRTHNRYTGIYQISDKMLKNKPKERGKTLIQCSSTPTYKSY